MRTLFLLAICGGLASGAFACSDTGGPAPELTGYAVRRAAPYRLLDDRGKVVLVSFGYTSCLEVCPQTFATVKRVLAELGPAANEVRFDYVTVDPERDRPEVLGPFLASVDPRFEGIFAEGAALKAMLEGYHVVVRKRIPDPGRFAARFYSMDHTSGFWGIDRRGRLRFRLNHDANPSDVLVATKKLVEEKP